jgi:prepilin-type N-terminal cleavage/methylation domain-containing protein
MRGGSNNRSLAVAAQKGITLMELLVAVMLLSLLSVGILFAFRTGLTAMGRTNDRLLSNRRVLGVERILEHQIAGFIPTKADCRAGPGAPAQRLPFFQGDPQTMRFVSTYSLQEASRGYPRILEFQVIPGENGEGVRLIVNEQLYSGPESTGMHCLGLRANPETQSQSVMFRPVAIGAMSYVLADKLAACRFAYREEREPPQPSIWRTQWAKDTTPAAVRIDMIPLVVDPAKLQVPAIVAPFRADRHIIENFADYEAPAATK